ncbi:MAG: SpoIIE family protein phosphatase [Candidatus Riflebacteria bacterium]|nr:SpoIIE family protein phosphatase [Candidatus Riflebacteria bacterium]
MSGLVFLVVPGLGLVAGLEREWEAREQEELAIGFKRLDDVILSLLDRSDTEVYLLDQLNEAADRADRADRARDGAGRLEAELDRLRRLFPGQFEFQAIDWPAGRLLPFSDPTEDLEALRNVADVTWGFRQERLSEAATLARLATGTLRFIGPCTGRDMLVTNRRILRFAGAGNDRRYFLPLSMRKAFVLAFVHETPDWGIVALGDLLRRLAPRLERQGVQAGVYDLAAGRLPPSPAMEGAGDGEAGGMAEAGWRHFTEGGRLFSVYAVTGTGRVWVGGTRPPAFSLTGRRLLLRSVAGLVVILLLGATWRQEVLPLRWRLLLLFVFAVGLPLLVIQVAGRDYLRDLRTRRTTESLDRADRVLVELDRRFLERKALMERFMTRRLRGLRFGTPAERAAAVRRVRRVIDRLDIFSGAVIDSRGRFLWESGGSGRYGDKNNQRFLGLLIKGVLDRINRSEDEDGGPSAGFVMEAISGLADPIAQIAESVGTIMSMAREVQQSWAFFLPIHRDQDRFRCLLALHWQRGEFEQAFLRREMRAWRRRAPDLGLYAALPSRNESVAVQPLPFRARLNRLVSITQAGQVAWRDWFRWGGRRYLALARRLGGLGGITVVAFQDDRPIRAELERVRGRLLGFTLLCAGIGIFLGLDLGRRFLTPIADLAEGVAAIKRRDFQVRLPVSGRDELGGLAATFNRVMAGLSDLEVGRIVQESLFPDRGVTCGEFRIEGRTLPAGALSGDYFDLQVLPDRRLLVLVGDVTGHGVPAALVMAMAKAAIAREIGQAADPVQFIQPLHRILLRTMARRRMMTCLLGLLDPARQVLDCVNAGHNYPIVFRQGGAAEILEGSSMPLGSWSRAIFQSFTIAFAPGDQLFVYSDGLIEAETGGEQIGLETMVPAVQARLAPTPAETIDRVLAWQRGLVGTSPQADDITVLVVARRPTADPTDTTSEVPPCRHGWRRETPGSRIARGPSRSPTP